MRKIHYYNWPLSYWTRQRCIFPVPVAPLNSPHSPELLLILQDVRGTFFSQFLWSNRNTKRIFSLSEFLSLGNEIDCNYTSLTLILNYTRDTEIYFNNWWGNKLCLQIISVFTGNFRAFFTFFCSLNIVHSCVHF